MHVVDFPDVPIAIHLHDVVAPPVELQRSGKQMRGFPHERTLDESRILQSFTQHAPSAATVEPCPDRLLHCGIGESPGGSGGRNLQARAPTDPGIAVPTRTDTNIDRNPRQADNTSLSSARHRTSGARKPAVLGPGEGCAAPAPASRPRSSARHHRFAVIPLSRGTCAARRGRAFDGRHLDHGHPPASRQRPTRASVFHARSWLAASGMARPHKAMAAAPDRDQRTRDCLGEPAATAPCCRRRATARAPWQTCIRPAFVRASAPW